MFLGKDTNISEFLLGDVILEVSSIVKLLGIYIDNKLQFKDHLDEKCSKASSKIRALLRIRSYLSLDTAKALCNAYILSNFNYCPY